MVQISILIGIAEGRKSSHLSGWSNNIRGRVVKREPMSKENNSERVLAFLDTKASCNVKRTDYTTTLQCTVASMEAIKGLKFKTVYKFRLLRWCKSGSFPKQETCKKENPKRRSIVKPSMAMTKARSRNGIKRGRRRSTSPVEHLRGLKEKKAALLKR